MTTSIILLGLILFSFCLCLGSFFNVVIYRMPLGLSVVHPPSACPVCKNSIKWYDNIPVFSWLVILRGKCRHCKTAISSQYPLVELGTGLIGVLGLALSLWVRGGLDFEHLLRTEILLMAAVPIVAIDFKHFLIPDLVVFPAALLMVAVTYLPGGMPMIDSIVGALGSSLGLWGFVWIASALLKKEAMGQGDVKLMLLLGACNGIGFTIQTLFIASASGMIFHIVQKLSDKGRAGMIPFGPFLLLGAFIGLMWGEPLMNAYWSFLGNPNG